ncbi:MAG: hypothetical protein COB53_11015, partial [Elusimicrobia bacterium]
MHCKSLLFRSFAAALAVCLPIHSAAAGRAGKAVAIKTGPTNTRANLVTIGVPSLAPTGALITPGALDTNLSLPTVDKAAFLEETAPSAKAVRIAPKSQAFNAASPDQGPVIKIKSARGLQRTARTAGRDQQGSNAGGQATIRSLNLLFDSSQAGGLNAGDPVDGSASRGISRPTLARPKASNAADTTDIPIEVDGTETTGPTGIKKYAQDALSAFGNWAVELYPSAADKAFEWAEKLEGRSYVSEVERKEYVKLRKSLAMNQLPAPISITVTGEADPARHAAGFQALPSVHKLATALEAGRQRPMDFHISMDPSWIDSKDHDSGVGKAPFIKKGITFDENGQAYVLTYKTPRPALYYANFLTQGAYGRPDGEASEKNLNVPQSSSLALWSVTGDKLKTRMLQAAEGAPVPKSLALLKSANPLRQEGALANLENEQVALREFPTGAGREAEIRKEVEAFLERHKETLSEEIVVKPSGRQWHSSQGVQFHSKTDIDGI